VRKIVNTFARMVLPALALALVVAPSAQAFNSIATAWTAYYDGSPGVTSQSLANMVAATTKNCQLCHESSNGGGSWNSYGSALVQRIAAGRTNNEAFADVEAANSDGDSSLPPGGWSNLLEIQYNGQPGWTYGSSNNIYDNNGAITGTASPPSGLTQYQIDPNPSVPVNATTWGRLKRLYGE